MAKEIKGLSKRLHDALDELVGILTEHESRLNKLEERLLPSRDTTTEVMSPRKKWEEKDFVDLSREQQQVLVYLLRNEGPFSTAEIGNKLSLSGRQVGGAISGFTQKQRKSRYEEIVKKTHTSKKRSCYIFAPEMKTKYEKLIEDTTGKALGE